MFISFVFFFRPEIEYHLAQCLFYISCAGNLQETQIVEAIPTLMGFLDSDIRDTTYTLEKALKVISNLIDEFPNIFNEIHVSFGDAQKMMKTCKNPEYESIFVRLIKFMLQSGELKLQREAARVIRIFFAKGTFDQIGHLIADANLFKDFCDLMASEDEICISIVLTGLKNLIASATKNEHLENLLTVSVHLRKFHLQLVFSANPFIS